MNTTCNRCLPATATSAEQPCLEHFCPDCGQPAYDGPHGRYLDDPTIEPTDADLRCTAAALAAS